MSFKVPRLVSPREWLINGTPERRRKLSGMRSALPQAEREELEREIAAKWAEAGFSPPQERS